MKTLGLKTLIYNNYNELTRLLCVIACIAKLLLIINFLLKICFSCDEARTERTDNWCVGYAILTIIVSKNSRNVSIIQTVNNSLNSYFSD